MVGAGSLIESPKAGFQNFLLQGLALAVALHIALLAIQLRFSAPSNNSFRPLSVSIQLQETKTENIPDDVRPAEPQIIDVRPRIIVAEATTEDPKPELKPRVQISTSDENLKRFLRSETDRNINNEENKLSEFSATFEPYYQAPEIVPEISYQDSQGYLGGGQYKVHKNGKVTCVLNMVPLSFDDHVYGAGGGAKDCTPKKKFDLNLRKSTRD